tara:strand:- start:299 stop:985 length:687 start_codon:yes stop_codon:yes gene_type:complete
MRPIERRSISTDVARQIQEMIAREGMVPADRLPTERQLAETLSVSRGAVREGLKVLAALEIIEIRQGAGIFVAKPQLLALIDPSLVTSTERRRLLKQTIVARRGVEIMIAELAVAEATDAALDGVESYLKHADSDLVRTKLAHAIDLEFEKKIAWATGNPYVAALQDEAHRYFRAVWEAEKLMPHSADVRSAQHWEILAALRARDSKRAVELMTAHLDAQGLGNNPSN